MTDERSEQCPNSYISRNGSILLLVLIAPTHITLTPPPSHHKPLVTLLHFPFHLIQLHLTLQLHLMHHHVILPKPSTPTHLTATSTHTGMGGDSPCVSCKGKQGLRFHPLSPSPPLPFFLFSLQLFFVSFRLTLVLCVHLSRPDLSLLLLYSLPSSST